MFFSADIRSLNLGGFSEIPCTPCSDLPTWLHPLQRVCESHCDFCTGRTGLSLSTLFNGINRNMSTSPSLQFCQALPKVELCSGSHYQCATKFFIIALIYRLGGVARPPQWLPQPSHYEGASAAAQNKVICMMITLIFAH